MKRMTWAVWAAGFLLSAWATGAVRADEDPWADFRFLIGSWVSESKPGEGSGSFTLEPDLRGKVLVRRNAAEIPATKDRPGGKHEDLMVVYRDSGGKEVRASCFDSEGHVIQYAVSTLPDKKGLVFVSSADGPGPRYRLTYTRGEDDKVAVKFEIAPPGKPEEFKTYLEGTVRPKKPGE